MDSQTESGQASGGHMDGWTEGQMDGLTDMN